MITETAAQATMVQAIAQDHQTMVVRVCLIMVLDHLITEDLACPVMAQDHLVMADTAAQVTDQDPLIMVPDQTMDRDRPITALAPLDTAAQATAPVHLTMDRARQTMVRLHRMAETAITQTTTETSMTEGSLSVQATK